MTQEKSDTTLLGELKAHDDPQAAQELWQRYFARLARLARTKLSQRQRRVRDEEDVALSAFHSFFRGVADGRFCKLNDGDDLWQVLVMLADRKAIDQKRRHLAAKRGGGEVRGDSAFLKGDLSSLLGGIDDIPGGEPNPALVDCFSETCAELLGSLQDPELVQVALLKMEGYTNDEIAQQLGRVTRSVERKLQTIRKIWEKQYSTDQ